VAIYACYPLYSENTLLCARYPFFSFFFFFIVLWKSNISAIKRVVKHEKVAIYAPYPLYSWKHDFWSKNSILLKNISAIKRVVKHKKMAIYVPYPLYRWEHSVICEVPLFSFFFPRSNRSKTMKFDQFNDVLYAVFVNFEKKIVFIFLKGIDNKISDFQWI